MGPEQCGWVAPRAAQYQEYWPTTTAPHYLKCSCRKTNKTKTSLYRTWTTLDTTTKTPISAGLFVDNGSLYMASSSPTTNARRLQDAFKRVITWVEQNGLKIDMNKVDYICFTWPHKRKIPPIPLVTLPTSTNPGETRTYKPQPHIKWLGLIFDSKLSFRQHVQHLASQGAAAAGCL